jgi:peptidoglycan/LPS O-acetylase OafA/YrhL
MLPLFFAVLFEPRAALLRKMLEIPALVWVGKISYSLYLWHFPIWVMTNSLPRAPHVLVALAASFAAAIASYYLVEIPLRYKRPALLQVKAA